MDGLISHYAGTFGVIIHADGNDVSIDPDFDAQWWQRVTEASVVYSFRRLSPTPEPRTRFGPGWNSSSTTCVVMSAAPI
ncbi:hypothetical protein [Nocardia sp. NPDC004260]